MAGGYENQVSRTDDQGRLRTYGRVAGVAVVGNEDGAHHVAAEVMQALNDVGFTTPVAAVTYWVGGAMGKPTTSTPATQPKPPAPRPRLSPPIRHTSRDSSQTTRTRAADRSSLSPFEPSRQLVQSGYHVYERQWSGTNRSETTTDCRYGGSMLSEREQRELADIERWLAVDFPDFSRRMTRRPLPSHLRWMLPVAVLLWISSVALPWVVGLWPIALVLGSIGWLIVGYVLIRRLLQRGRS